MISFTSQVIDSFNVSVNAVRVAVVQYTDTGEMAISPGQYTNKTLLQQAVNNISYVATSRSNLTFAFNKLQTSLYYLWRPVAVLVYVTNRVPIDSYSQLASTITTLQSAGVRLVSVGAFQQGVLSNNTRQLLSYYYDMLMVNDYTQLTNVVNQTAFNACPLRGQST